MRNAIFVAIAAVLVTLVLAGSGVQVERELELSPDVCAKMDDSLLNPFRCADKHPSLLGAAGRSFLEKAKQASASNLVLDPVIILPGLGGSGFEAKLNKKSASHWYCTKNIDWFRIWLHLEELVVQDCWLDNMDLDYDVASGTWSEPEGVEIRPIDFGGVMGIDYLDYQFGKPVTLATYYGELIKSFEAVGYVPGVNLRGVPYDWRYTPSELKKQGLFTALRALIEDTRARNDNRTVHIIGHSQGCITSLAFLHDMPDDWVAENIASYIPIAGPFGGAPKALKAVLSGDDFGLHIGELSLINRLKLRSMVQDFGGVIFLSPDAEVWGDTPIVNTSARVYYARDMPQLFADMKAPQTLAVFNQVKNELLDLSAPNVRTYCLYGTGVPTETTYVFPGTDFDAEPEVVRNSLGDGTVPLESLRECIKWSGQQEQPVYVNEFNLKNHIAILKDEGLIHYILDKVTHDS